MANINTDFPQDKQEIKSLFIEAGLEDFMIIHQEFLGFGNYANLQISGFDNMTNNRQDIVTNITRSFNETQGVFKKRYKDSYNPIFWIDYTLKLPQYLFQFFGILPEKLIVKVFLVLYWLLAVFLGLKKLDILEYLLNKWSSKFFFGFLLQIEILKRVNFI